MNLENYSTIKTLLLEELLGSNSSLAFSKKLGFKFDKYRRWMQSESILRLEDFFQICKLNNLEVEKGLDIFKFSLPNENGYSQLFNHLRDYNVLDSNKALAEYLKCHVSVVKRYVKGEVEPDVETIFKLMDYRSNHLPLFFRRLFASNIKHPILKGWILENVKAPQFESTLPLSSMVEAILSLESYKEFEGDSAEFIADLLEREPTEVKSALDQMTSSNVIRLEQHKYKIQNNTTNLDGISFQDIIPFIQYINAKMIMVLEKRKDPYYQLPWTPGVMAYRVFPASIQSVQKINTILLRANAEILKELEEDQHPKIEARAILLQNFGITK